MYSSASEIDKKTKKKTFQLCNGFPCETYLRDPFGRRHDDATTAARKCFLFFFYYPRGFQWVHSAFANLLLSSASERKTKERVGTYDERFARKRIKRLSDDTSLVARILLVSSRECMM